MKGRTMTETHTHVVSFETFSNSWEFESWQRQNPQFKVATVSPIFEKMYVEPSFNARTGSEDNSEFTPEFQVFVTYLKPLQEEE
jgi:hypothetical protein